MAERLQTMGQPNYRNGFELALQPQMLELPLQWKKPQTSCAARTGTASRCSRSANPGRGVTAGASDSDGPRAPAAPQRAPSDVHDHAAARGVAACCCGTFDHGALLRPLEIRAIEFLYGTTGPAPATALRPEPPTGGPVDG
jgi:hypothetical protein